MKKLGKIPDEYWLIKRMGGYPNGWDEPIKNVFVLSEFEKAE